MSVFKKIEKVQLVNHNENYVYCIKTEKNHNFNANGINLSNCCIEGDGVIEVINKETKMTEVYKIKDFIAKFVSNTDVFADKINTGYQIKSYNYKTNQYEIEDITGLVKKVWDSHELIKINIDGHICAFTWDHHFTVRDINSGEIKEVIALDIFNNPDKYEIGIEE